MNEFKRPFRECAIVVICTVFLVISSLSTGSGNPEHMEVDAAVKRNAAPAVLNVSETTKEENDMALNESGAVLEEAFEASGNFEALGTFEAYETVKLLQSVQSLTEEASGHETEEALREEETAGMVSERQPETAGQELSEEQPETITAASAEAAKESEAADEEVLPEDSTPPETISSPGGDGLSGNLEAAGIAALPADAAAVLPATEAAGGMQEQLSAEEISISDAETEEADCAAASAETDVCGLSASEYDALCRIVEAEAGTEGEEGKLLVANVVLNRVADPAFPATIEGVITADGQFSPVQNGRYQRAVPTSETLAAVNRALNGENISKGALYFKSVHSTANWGNRTLLYNYRNHNFYQ